MLAFDYFIIELFRMGISLEHLNKHSLDNSVQEFMDRFISTALFCKVKGCSNSSGNVYIFTITDKLSLTKAITFGHNVLGHSESEICSSLPCRLECDQTLTPFSSKQITSNL